MRILLIFLMWSGAAGAAAEPFYVSDGVGLVPDVAALTDSTAVVVYITGDRAYFRLIPSGGETRLAPEVEMIEATPAVCVLPNGGFAAAWLRIDGADKRAVARLFDAAGQPTTEVFLPGGTGEAADVDVAARPDGSCVVTLAEFGPPGFANVHARIHDAAGQPISPLYEVSGDPGVFNVHPRVAVGPGGEFTVTWGVVLHPDSAARARRHPGAGDVWEDVWPVAADAAFPAIALDGHGHRLLAWTTTTGRIEIRVRREGFAETVIGGSDAGVTALDMHPDGTAIAAWHEDASADAGVLLARVIDREGQPAGDILTVASGTKDADGIPAVAVSAQGRTIFTWEDHTTGRIMACWRDDLLVPVARTSWGSLKNAWR